jgi:hypothetical protein
MRAVAWVPPGAPIQTAAAVEPGTLRGFVF